MPIDVESTGDGAGSGGGGGSVAGLGEIAKFTADGASLNQDNASDYATFTVVDSSGNGYNGDLPTWVSINPDNSQQLLFDTGTYLFWVQVNATDPVNISQVFFEPIWVGGFSTRFFKQVLAGLGVDSTGSGVVEVGDTNDQFSCLFLLSFPENNPASHFLRINLAGASGSGTWSADVGNIRGNITKLV